MGIQHSPDIVVYFDGLCRLCSAEIEHYRVQQGSDKIRFVDITDLAFNAETEGVDPFKVHQIMHVKKSDGTFALKVQAFIEIWKVLPRYQWAARWAEMKGVRPFLDSGYWMFTKVRPYLPRKTKDCSNSPYCESHNA